MATFTAGVMARGRMPQSLPGMTSLPVAPPGTFVPGTKVQCGQHRVIIERYLSEGGFAHVYVVTLPSPVDGETRAVLKRVAVPDKEHLTAMRNEVDTMKRLRGHKQIVKYIDSHASPLKAGGFEVFLLMEFCQGGGLIDFMNTRLQNRLTEPEIVKIFTDIAEGVACMHYLKPPLLHRDLKVENVLISKHGNTKIFKVCDFGSAAPPRPAATSAAEGRSIEDDIQRHTTLQYRSPEMIDVYRKQPIDEKSDMWALGVFLYKLCYYTTPFEEIGQTAILNAKFKFPGYPRFSDELKLLIASMLRENSSDRPNIYQVLGKACKMDGRPLPVRDIYAERTKSEISGTQSSLKADNSPSRAGATLSPPMQKPVMNIPDIEPMRRGRPSAPASQHTSAKPSPSPLRIIEGSDPFAQLDARKTLDTDEISHKYPTLDQFSLINSQDGKFAFPSSQFKGEIPADNDLSEKVTAALADEAFARSPSPAESKPDNSKTSQEQPSARLGRDQMNHWSSPSPSPLPSDQKSGNPVPVSTSRMQPAKLAPIPPFNAKSIHRFPPSDYSSNTAKLPPWPSTTRPSMVINKSGSRLANLLKEDASQSQAENSVTSSSSARPSMESNRPAREDMGGGISRSRSLNLRARPASVKIGAGPTHIKDAEIRKPDFDNSLSRSKTATPELVVAGSDATPIASDIDFLKAKEEEEKERVRQVKGISSSSKQSKRTSLPSMSMSGTKNLLSGRFGDAFKRFENQGPKDDVQTSEDGYRNSSLTPIAGSEATDLSDDRNGFEETEELSPEMRRELEKRALEAEERRVAEASARYRQQVGSRAGPPTTSTKAALIQNRVQSLIQDSGRPVQKTAAGYGQYTNSEAAPAEASPRKSATFQSTATEYARREIPSAIHDIKSSSAPSSAVNLQKIQKPVAPPKPRVLQWTTGARAAPSAERHEVGDTPVDLAPGEDWEAQFSKKYPSLSNFEMVETDIGLPSRGSVSTREV